MPPAKPLSIAATIWRPAPEPSKVTCPSCDRLLGNAGDGPAVEVRVISGQGTRSSHLRPLPGNLTLPCRCGHWVEVRRAAA